VHTLPLRAFREGEIALAGVSGSQIISIMQPADSGHGNDLSVRCRILFSLSLSRGFLAQPEMRPVLVVVADVLGHQSFQMALIQDDDMIKQIAAAVSDKASCDTVLPGRLAD